MHNQCNILHSKFKCILQIRGKYCLISLFDDLSALRNWIDFNGFWCSFYLKLKVPVKIVMKQLGFFFKKNIISWEMLRYCSSLKCCFAVDDCGDKQAKDFETRWLSRLNKGQQRADSLKLITRDDLLLENVFFNPTQFLDTWVKAKLRILFLA